jgi:gluconolactonase
VWFADLECLLVSDLPNDRILRWSEDAGVSTFRQPSGFANGHSRDREGRLLGCSHQHRCITRTELDGAITVLAHSYRERRLNSPNDIVCKSDGTIWFTDPHYGINTDYEGGKQTPELPAAASTLPSQDSNSTPIRHATSASSTSPMTARGSSAAASSTRSRPASPTAFAATPTAISGAAPPTACT